MFLRGLLAAAGLLLAAAFAEAASLEDFYRGKTIYFLIGEDVGGGYDSYSRLLAGHLGRHIPGNPIIVPQNMPGAAGLTAANHLYMRAPKDGTVVGMIDQGLYLDQALGKPGIEFDTAKFNWIGRLLRVTGVLVAWQSSPIRSIEDLKRHELIVSATGASSRQNWVVLNELVGTKLKIIGGYAGTANSALALERGEIEGMSFPWSVLSSTYRRWLDEGKVTVLLQTALDIHPDIPQVPRMIDLAADPETVRILRLFSSPYSIGRAVVAPPAVPPEIVAGLRRAFDDTIADPEFRAAAAKSKLELDPLPGAALQSLIADGGDLSPALIERVRALVEGDKTTK